MVRIISKKPEQVEPNHPDGQAEPVDQKTYQDVRVSADLNYNLEVLKKILGQNDDIVFRRFFLGIAPDTQALMVYVDGMVDKTILNNNILKSLMLESTEKDLKIPREGQLKDTVLNYLLTAASLKETVIIGEVISSILSGAVILMIDGVQEAILIDIRNFMQRAISEPPSEVMVRGSREGFNEALRTNIVLIRRHINSPNLVFESFNIGRVSSTAVSLVYIKGIADPRLIEEARKRLNRIDIDGVLESGYIEDLIEDDPFSPFPQMHHTERPDRVAGNLLEGRVAILTDGSPFALVLPVEISSFLTAPEDYYERFILASAIRWVRYISFMVSLFLPSIYIAVITFHQEMIPIRLLYSIAAYRQGVPLPTLVEALAMELMFEVLREAGVRLPRSVGQTVSIAGALVIGQSAVTAGIVSPLMVIVVAATGLASFTIPSYNLGISIRLLRFPLMLLAGTMGLFGIAIGLIIMVVHAMKLRSFGVPFMASLAPLHISDLKDVIIRVPWWAMDERPAELARNNRRRQGLNQKPAPPLEQNNKPQGGH